ncbi:hypothetical protein [Clostridium sp. C2-6-12]|uniref:hypothetical protein n=1 Tax=Clostridium sp. C2-6-12 TaxID=2698832 RepID=UPI001367AB88|nr:hypothetical protein [Clostridium sp. C2-6-12]
MLCKKELAFEFFKNNPHFLYDKSENDNYKLLGIKQSTYKRYVYEYKSIYEANEADIEVKTQENKEIYFKNRLRQKFIFDDTSLFKC